MCAIDAFVAELDLTSLGFDGADPAITGRPSYHPAVPRRIYVYGHSNGRTSRRSEREAQRKDRANVAHRPLGAGFQDNRGLSNS